MRKNLFALMLAVAMGLLLAGKAQAQFATSLSRSSGKNVMVGLELPPLYQEVMDRVDIGVSLTQVYTTDAQGNKFYYWTGGYLGIPQGGILVPGTTKIHVGWVLQGAPINPRDRKTFERRPAKFNAALASCEGDVSYQWERNGAGEVVGICFSTPSMPVDLYQLRFALTHRESSKRGHFLPFLPGGGISFVSHPQVTNGDVLPFAIMDSEPLDEAALEGWCQPFRRLDASVQERLTLMYMGLSAPSQGLSRFKISAEEIVDAYAARYGRPEPIVSQAQLPAAAPPPAQPTHVPSVAPAAPQITSDGLAQMIAEAMAKVSQGGAVAASASVQTVAPTQASAVTIAKVDLIFNIIGCDGSEVIRVYSASGAQVFVDQCKPVTVCRGLDPGVYTYTIQWNGAVWTPYELSSSGQRLPCLISVLPGMAPRTVTLNKRKVPAGKR